MAKTNSSTGFDSNGNPCDSVGDDGYIWIYLGKNHGFDNWEGIPYKN